MKFLNILIISILLTSCTDTNDSQKNDQNATETNEKSALSTTENMLTLGKVSKINFGETLEVTGMIDVPPKNKSVISTFMAGYIVKTPLLIGDKVSKGQLLVSLENPEYVDLQQNYLELSEQLTYLKSEYNRQKTLYEENITSEKNYLKAQSDYKSNLARYNGLKRKLQMLNINPETISPETIVSTINLYAPIEGHITKVNVSNGAYVSANDVIMEIVDTDHIHLELSVFEKDIMRIKKGQKIEFQIPEASEATFNADVHLVGTSIDETTRRVKVHGHVDNEEHQFIVGMYVTAKIILNNDLRYGLPNSAILQEQNNNFVITAEKTQNGHFSYKKVNVNVGSQNEENSEILNPKTLIDKSIVIKNVDELANSL